MSYIKKQAQKSKKFRSELLSGSSSPESLAFPSPSRGQMVTPPSSATILPQHLHPHPPSAPSFSPNNVQPLTMWKYMKTNQKRISGGYLSNAGYSKRVSHHHLHFSRDSKAGSRVGKTYRGKKGRLHIFYIHPNGKLLVWGLSKQAR